jgi:Amt family ammonium transporter
VTPVGAIGIGLGASALCYLAVAVLKPRLGYDDSLDVFGVHGVGGTWGAIAVALFLADFAMPEGGSKMSQLWIQLKSIGLTAVFAPAATVVILYGLKLAMGDLRVHDEDEAEGLDYALHSETAYGSGGEH